MMGKNRNVLESHHAGGALDGMNQSEGFVQVAQNQLGDDTYASPVFVDNELIMRVGFRNDGTRREVLYCLAK